MMANKGKPTQWTVGPSIPCIYAVERECTQLAEQFGFQPDYDLAEALKGALRVHFGYRINDMPETDSASMAALLDLQKALPKVAKALSALGPNARLRIRHNLPSPLRREWSHRIERDIKAIEAAIEAAIAKSAQVKPKRSGGAPASPERTLVLELGAIYERGTGKSATSYYSDPKGTYQGGATEFVSTILAMCGDEISDPLADSQIGRMFRSDQS